MEEALRNIELEVGQIKRRQSGIMDYLREIRDTMHMIEKKMVSHDRWERRRADEEP